jgi:hypothetical protein
VLFSDAAVVGQESLERPPTDSGSTTAGIWSSLIRCRGLAHGGGSLKAITSSKLLRAGVTVRLGDTPRCVDVAFDDGGHQLTVQAEALSQVLLVAGLGANQ